MAIIRNGYLIAAVLKEWNEHVTIDTAYIPGNHNTLCDLFECICLRLFLFLNSKPKQNRRKNETERKNVKTPSDYFKSQRGKPCLACFDENHDK